MPDGAPDPVQQVAQSPEMENDVAPPPTKPGIYRRMGAAGPLAVIAGTLPPLGGFVLLGFITKVAPWLRSHQEVGLTVYVVGFTTLAALALLPTYACAIVGGWTFGFAVGFPAAMFSFCAAAMLAYAINARAAGGRVIEIIREHPKWEAVVRALIGRGFWRSFWIIMLLRLPPVSPFAAMNFIMGTTRAPVGAYLLGTLIGMAPRTAVAVWGAAHASTLDFKDSGQTWMFVAGLAVTVGVVVVIGRIANKAVQRVTGVNPMGFGKSGQGSTLDVPDAMSEEREERASNIGR